MATIDLRGATVSAADPPVGTNPNPDLAVKAPVRVATTGGNITLSGLQTIDGVALNAGDRVLVKDQTDQTTNGIYNAQTGPWTRTIDAANNSQWAQATQVRISNGGLNNNTVWTLQTADPIVLGTSALAFLSGTNVIGSAIVLVNNNPVTSSYIPGLNINIAPTGTALGGGYNANVLSITGDAVDAGAGFGNGLLVQLLFGDPSAQGGRQAIFGTTSLTATTSPSSGNRNYVGVSGVGQAIANDNGTGTTTATALGAVFGGGFIGALFTGATNFLNVTGAEFNSFVQSGASVALKSLLQVSADPRDRVQGAVVDTMFWAYNQSALSPGFNNGLLFDNAGGIGAWPIAPGGTVIKTGGNGAAANGIDLSNTTFSGYAFLSHGFSVSPNGAIGSGSAGVANGSMAFAGSTSGSSILSANATATAWTLSGASLGVNNTDSSGICGLALTTVQNTPNPTDLSDSALSVNHTLSANSATNELVSRVLFFSVTNNLTGGGALQNARCIDLVTNTQAGTTTTSLECIYLEAGAAAGTVTTGIGLHVVSLQGATKWGVADDSGSNWYNAAGGLSLGSITAAGNGNLLATGSLLSKGTAGIGYATGAGGAVTQATSKSTGVTLNKITGQITMNNAALAAGTIVSFVLTNSTIAATDLVLIEHISGGTVGGYTVTAGAAAGSATLSVRNNTGSSLSEALVLQFVVIKAVTS
jgi:hypothetical protein